MKAVAYYRTRPSEPEASDTAFRLQREAVQREIEASGFDLVAEFVEREGEEGSETYPAYAAAVRAALACGERDDVLDAGLITLTALIIATQAAIGRGEPFQEPEVEVVGENGIFRTYLQVPSIPAPPEIVLPTGAPAPLCLYADCRSRQLDTLVYLCNAGPDLLAEVTVTTDSISMHRFYTSEPSERWVGLDNAREQRWDAVPPGTCVLVNSLDHWIWDEVDRYRVTFTDAAGRRWMAEADDLPLNACRLAQDPNQVWVDFGPPHPIDQTASGARPAETR